MIPADLDRGGRTSVARPDTGEVITRWSLRGRWPTTTALVPGAGFEPARPFGQWILSPPRLPFRHPGWRGRSDVGRAGNVGSVPMDGAAPPIGLSEAWAAVGEHGAFALDCVELWWIDVPFVRPVSTAVGVHRNRPLVLVQLRGSADGRSVDGWGECAALADTTYDDEDVAGSFFALEHRLVPALVEQATRSHGRLPRPSALDGIRRAAPGGTLAFAALEMAVADAHLRSESRSFAQVLGVENRQIEIGAVVGTSGDTGTLVG